MTPAGGDVGSRSLKAASPLARLGDVTGAADAEIRGDPDTLLADAAYDSRSVPARSLFFCVPGRTFDGHAFAADAARGGASALVVERWIDAVDLPQARVGSVRAAMGPMSSVLFGSPAARMRSVGVTGTNGKTTTTYLLEAVLAGTGSHPGVIGTTGARIGSVPIPLDRTTPEAPDLHRLLARMRSEGVDAVALEVSSHALAEHRVDGLRFDVAVFTNLSQDHLDFHGSMEAYFASKARLFTPAMAMHGIVNVDDDWGRRLASEAAIPVTTYAVEGPADVTADPEPVGRGSTFRFGDIEVRVGLSGRFNVANALATMIVADRLGVDASRAAEAMASVSRVPGRMEPIEAGQPFLVMVDYAHTPDSIQHVLRGARPLVAGRVIVVFGCGGDRDRAKRPSMGAAATAVADLTIITSDNPRTEDPLEIIGQIEAGARSGGGPYEVEPDRRLAIRRAVREARAGDVVIIAGKGHETVQERGGERIPFDDREVAREELLAGREERA